MRRRISVPVLVAVVVAALVIAAGILWLAPSSDYILLPDVAHPVAPLVSVQGAHPAKGPGELFFVDVLERRASELEKLFPWIHDGASLVPASLLVPKGVSDQAARQADLREMAVSQQIAAAVALRYLGYKVVAKPSGVIVDAVEPQSHAYGELRPADVITGVNGVSTPTVGSLRTQIDKLHPGDTARMSVRRGSQTLTVSARTIHDPTRPGDHAIVGFAPDQAATIKLPLKVSIDAGNVGGPSAGLAFTLQVLAELGRNVTHGYKVAATGQIELNGDVTAIGGVEQKTYGVREAHADVFLVPVDGGNAAEAEHYAHGLKIIPVTTFRQALRALAKLPPKR